MHKSSSKSTYINRKQWLISVIFLGTSSDLVKGHSWLHHAPLQKHHCSGKTQVAQHSPHHWTKMQQQVIFFFFAKVYTHLMYIWQYFASYLSIRPAAIKCKRSAVITWLQFLLNWKGTAFTHIAITTREPYEWVLQDLTTFHTWVSLPPDKIEMCLSSALCFPSEYLGQLNFAINLQEQNPDLQTHILRRASRSSREAQPMAKKTCQAWHHSC